MRWANYLLACRFFEEAIGIVLGDPRLRTESVDNYDRVSHTHRDREPSLSQLVKQCLEEDVNGKFKNKCVKNNPQANFKEIAKRRLLKQKWKDIATDLGVRASTLSDFYQRCLVEFSSEFKDYIQN